MAANQTSYDEKYLELVRSITLSIVNQSQDFVYLFGSWAHQDQDQTSDIDIAIWGPDALGSTFHKLTNALEESIVPYPVDIVDFSQADDNFRQKALQGAVLWNQPSDFKIS